MTIWLRQRLSDGRGPFLDRLMLWSAILLVFAVASFAIYYYLDQQGRGDAGPGAHDIARYEQAVRANPEDMGARMALADLYYVGERYSESAEQYQAVLVIDEESTLAMVGLGRALLAVGDEAGAISNFQEIIDLAKDTDMPGELVETAYYYLGSVSLDQQQLTEAIAHLKQALAIERADADAWHLLGAAYLESGDLDEAITALSQAVAFVPDFTEAYEKLALAYERKGLVAEGHYARGMLAFSHGQYSEAEDELEAALAASPALAEAHVGLGLVRESQGYPQLALSSYYNALQFDSNNFSARAGLARLGVPAPESATEENVTP